MTVTDAIILAGGRATRMGGVDKPGIVVGGRSMLETAIAAVSGGRSVVVVGPHRDLPSHILQTQESPVGAGPVAGIAAGLAALRDDADLVVVLASDLPFVSAGSIAGLIDAAADLDVVCAVDREGREQYLASVWKRSALNERLVRLGELDNQPMRALMGDLPVTRVPVDDLADVDTPAAVAKARKAFPMTVAEARSAVRAGLRPLPVRAAKPADALGGALAEPLIAAAPLPRFDVSAMDGYAVNGEGPWTLHDAVVYAGGSQPDVLPPSCAVRIATGAHLPPGTTGVVRDEFATVQNSTLSRIDGTPTPDDRRKTGENWQPGDLLVPAGTAVSPAVVSVAASAEVGELAIRGPVCAHLVVTGDEIRREGPLRRGQTRDSIGPVLPRYLDWCGVRTVTEAHLRDTAEGFDSILAEAQADVIIVVGATGHGAADHLRLALDRAGATIIVERVKSRPGGSQIIAALPDGRVVLGLPGNPFAAIATALMQCPTIVETLTGRTPSLPELVRLTNAGSVSADAARVIPAAADASGGWVAFHPRLQTAHLAALSGQSGVVIVPPDCADDELVELLRIPTVEM